MSPSLIEGPGMAADSITPSFSAIIAEHAEAAVADRLPVSGQMGGGGKAPLRELTSIALEDSNLVILT